jgi:DNA-binding transcriptional regulator YiaG/uncharacterized DUF497 family protein
MGLAKNETNIIKHGVSFEQASKVFADGNALDIFDDIHSELEERFITIGLIPDGPVLVVWTDLRMTQFASFPLAGLPNGKRDDIMNKLSASLSDDIPELTARELASAIPSRIRKRLMQGKFESGEDIASLRRFVQLTQEQFAQALGISVHTLRNWEQGRRTPEGPALALLRIAAKHPRIIRENIESAA